MTRYLCSCHSIDTLIGGGFETGIVTQVYGEPTSGKTTLCLQLAVRILSTGKRAVFIGTQRFPSERFVQIAGIGAGALAQKLLVYEVTSFEQQSNTLREVKKVVREDIGLIVLDSATAYYRLEQAKHHEGFLKRKLVNQVLFLLGLARKYDLAAVITNQIYTEFETNEVLPVAGNILENLSAVIIQFERVTPDVRCAVLKRHQSLPEGATAKFRLVEQGLIDA